MFKWKNLGPENTLDSVEGLKIRVKVTVTESGIILKISDVYMPVQETR